MLSKNIFYPLFLLLIPLISMLFTNEVNWSLLDFLVMGVMIFCCSISINKILSKSKSKINYVYVVFVIVIFLLLWIEIAVGIFDSSISGS